MTERVKDTQFKEELPLKTVQKLNSYRIAINKDECMKIKNETTPLEHYQNRLNAEKENKKTATIFRCISEPNVGKGGPNSII